ncbi:unnamed protein product, partial [Urochloa humidicola]
PSHGRPHARAATQGFRAWESSAPAAEQGRQGARASLIPNQIDISPTQIERSRTKLMFIPAKSIFSLPKSTLLGLALAFRCWLRQQRIHEAMMVARGICCHPWPVDDGSGPHMARPYAFRGAGHLVCGMAQGGGRDSETRPVGGGGVQACVEPRPARKLSQAAATAAVVRVAGELSVTGSRGATRSRRRDPQKWLAINSFALGARVDTGSCMRN